MTKMDEQDEIWKQQFAQKLALIIKEIDPEPFYKDLLRHASFKNTHLIQAVQQIINSQGEDQLNAIMEYYDMLSYDKIDDKNIIMNFILNLLILNYFIKTNQLDNSLKIISNLEVRRTEYTHYMKLLLNYFTAYYYLLVGRISEARILLDNIQYSIVYEKYPNLLINLLVLSTKIYFFFDYPKKFQEFLSILESMKGFISISNQSKSLILEMKLNIYLKNFEDINLLYQAFSLKELHNPLFKAMYLYSNAMQFFYARNYLEAKKEFEKTMDFLFLQKTYQDIMEYMDIIFEVKYYYGLCLVNLNELQQARIVFEELRKMESQNQMQFLSLRALLLIYMINENEHVYEFLFQSSDTELLNKEIEELIESNSIHPLSFLLLGLKEFYSEYWFQSLVFLEKSLNAAKAGNHFFELGIALRYYLLVQIKIFGAKEFFHYEPLTLLSQDILKLLDDIPIEHVKLELLLIKILNEFYQKDQVVLYSLLKVFSHSYVSVWNHSIFSNHQNTSNKLMTEFSESVTDEKPNEEAFIQLISKFINFLKDVGIHSSIISLYLSNLDLIREHKGDLRQFIVMFLEHND